MVNLAWLLDVAANFDVEAGSNASASRVKRLKRDRKRKRASPVVADFDVEAESAASHSGAKRDWKRKRVSPVCLLQDSDCGMKKIVKHAKRRWTQEESELLYFTFGKDITNKMMPSGVRIGEIAQQMGTRTIPQIRTQLRNYITGKLCR